MLWADLFDGRYTWQEASQRALPLLDTVRVPNDIVNSGLMDLYYLWQPDAARDPASQWVEREHWRAMLPEYDIDPAEWDFSHYRRMLTEVIKRRGVDEAREFGALLVSDGLPLDSDVQTALQDGKSDWTST
jgi:hypothetical protein